MKKWNDIEQNDDKRHAPIWMVTFSDMMTLLLTFFIMLVAMSEIEIQRFQEALGYFQGHTGILQNEHVITSSLVGKLGQTSLEQAQEQARNYNEFLQYIKDHDLEDKVHANLTENGLEVTITDSVMFRSGKAVLIEPSKTILRLLAGMINPRIKTIVVAGHTDTRPIGTMRFPSNWELSTARATAVVRFLHAQNAVLPPSNYVAIGYGEHHPVASNESPTGRARNRRVEIFFSWTSWKNLTHPLLK